MTSSKTIIIIAATLVVGLLAAGIIKPELISLDAFMLAVIAAYLGGIYAELTKICGETTDGQVGRSDDESKG